MRGLFYSRATYQPDPPVLSLSLCKGLLEEFEIDFLCCSPIASTLLVDPRFHLMTLPPYSEEQKASRLFLLKQQVKPPYAFLICEVFPFREFDLEKEVIFLINWLKKANPACLILGSIPEFIEFSEIKLIDEAVTFASKYFDALLVHADKKLIGFTKSSPLKEQLIQKVLLTGFIPNSLGPPLEPVARRKRILVPISRHKHGKWLVVCLLKVIAYFPDYEFVFVLPQNAPAFLSEYIKEWEASHTGSLIQILPPQINLQPLLRSSALAICFPDSTLIDAIHTRTSTMVLPLGTQVQLMRLRRLFKKGMVKQMKLKDFIPRKLRQEIARTLKTPYPEPTIDLEGAAHALQQLKQLLKKR